MAKDISVAVEGMEGAIARLVNKYPSKKSVIISHMSQCRHYSEGSSCAFLDDLEDNVPLAKLKKVYSRREERGYNRKP